MRGIIQSTFTDELRANNQYITQQYQSVSASNNNFQLEQQLQAYENQAEEMLKDVDFAAEADDQ